MEDNELREKLMEIGVVDEKTLDDATGIPIEQRRTYVATINLLNEILEYSNEMVGEEDSGIKLLTLFDAILLTICDTVSMKERMVLLDNVVQYYLKEDFDIDATNIILNSIEDVGHRSKMVDKAYG